MSEKIYAWLLRLYPSHFRRLYGAEAMRLFRDRSHDESGFLLRLRLWSDLLTDMAVSLPREYRRKEPALSSVSVQQHFDGIPEFRSLDMGESPRPGALVSGACLSLLGFAAVSVLIMHGPTYQPLFLRGGHAQPSAGAHSSPSGHPSTLPPGNEKVMEPSGPAHDVSSQEASNPQPINIAGRKAVPQGIRVPANAQQQAMNVQPQPQDATATLSPVRENVKEPNGPALNVKSQEAGNLQPIKTTSKQAAQQGVSTPANGQQRGMDGQPKPQDATPAILQAFNTHDIVMLGENHGVKQEYEWLDKLVATPAFDDRVDDIVVEFGNSLYQKTVDRYVAGEDVPLAQIEKAWRNMVGSVGPVSPVYPQFYKAVRDANLRRHGKHQMRIVLGDPYGDWDKIKDAEDLGPYVAHRDEWYAQVVEDEVLAKHHRALLIMGAGHFLRRHGPGLVEHEIRSAGANPYLVVFGANAVDGYDNLDRRFNAWRTPAVVPFAGNWVGELSAVSVTTGGVAPPSPLKLADAADALLYVAPRDSLTQVNLTRRELDGTAYEKELNRRMMIQTGHGLNPVSDQADSPMFQRPQPQPSAASPHSLPPMPRSARDPLPPRPQSQ